MRYIKYLLLIILVGGVLILQGCGEDAGVNEYTPDGIEEVADDIADPATEPVVTDPPTEPPTTTEKPPVITEEIIKWTFTEDDMIFRAANQVTDLRVEDGILKLTSIGGDPFLHTIDADLEINAADVDYIKIRIRNMSDGFDNQLFFITNDDMGWSEDKSFRESYWNSEGEDWEIITYHTLDSDNWEGTIKQIRFDPLTTEGDVEIEYVLFEKIVR